MPPLWTGSSPFEGRIDDTMNSEAFSEAQEGMQWVNGKGWVEAEQTFLQSFNSAPPLLRRSGSRPSTAPKLVPAGESELLSQSRFAAADIRGIEVQCASGSLPFSSSFYFTCPPRGFSLFKF